MAPALPPFAPFPSASWIDIIPSDEWAACLETWVVLAETHLSLSEPDFTRISLKDESLSAFLVTFVRGQAAADIVGSTNSSSSTDSLSKASFLLASRCLKSASPPNSLLQWEFLSNLARVFGKKRVSQLLQGLSKPAQATIDTSVAGLKKYLIKNLDDGLKGDLKGVEERLGTVDFLIHASPQVASNMLAGTDFVDGLINCFKIMNPPLRKAIILTMHLCLVGLTEGESPKYSMLNDQLFSLKAAADAHKAGPLNVNDSMIAELVTVTPLIQQIERRLDVTGTLTKRMKTVLKDLEGYRKPGVGLNPRKATRRKIDKGKGRAVDEDVDQDLHIHQMSQISQVQDLFPELGSGFVAKLLGEYSNDTEQIIAHLLEDNLPPHLQKADRGEQLSSSARQKHHANPTLHAVEPQLPVRRNIFDDDELDRLAVDTSQLHFGKHAPDKTADDILNKPSTSSGKAAILSALAAFDSDDDERDDTYDAEDVGGAVDGSVAGEDVHLVNDAVLFKAYQTTPKVFDRDNATRKGEQRAKLKEETGMTDEAIEGWGLMLSRNPQQKRRLEAKMSLFSGIQPDLAPSAWRASPAGSGAEDSGTDTGPSYRGRGGRGRGQGIGGRGRGGNVVGPTGEAETEQARRRKEANKGSRANHNRRDQRAKKMSRGGFPG